ncbi:restriction endonuclease subunit S [Henriciella sp. AS95]|uniref:restriction endonuclease subunit S n=1 Tax=Henriciella sp. AS95 TaxID=3135782 RepID=UPI0031773929
MKAGWELRALGEFSEIKYGYTAKAARDAVGPRFLRITDIQDGRVDWDQVPYCKITEKDHAKHSVSKGDIVFARTGATTGKSFLISEAPDTVCASYLIKVRPNDEIVESSFLNLYFQTSEYWQHISLGTEGAAQGGFNATKLAALPIPLPPLQEQRRIVAVLDEAFEGLARARENTEANLASAREFFPSGVSQIFSESDGWERLLISEVGEVFDGPHATPKTIDKGPLFLGISSLIDGRIELGKTRHVTEEDFAKWTRRVEPEAGDVVFSYETRLGQVGLIPEGMRCCLGRRMGLVRLNEDIVSPEFFVAYYLSPFFQDFLRKSTVKGATVDRISIKDFPNFPVLVPPKKVQGKIIDQIAHFREVNDGIVEKVLAKLQDLADLRQSLLQKAFAGELT